MRERRILVPGQEKFRCDGSYRHMFLGVKKYIPNKEKNIFLVENKFYLAYIFNILLYINTIIK